MAAATLLLFFLAQVAGAMLVAATTAVIALLTGGAPNPRALTAAIARSGPIVVLVSFLLGGAAALFAARAWAWNLVKDKSRNGIGLAAPRAAQLLACSAAGLLLASGYVALAHFLFPARPGTPLGPLLQIATSSPLGQVIFAVLAVFLAPPVEELLFRGLLLRGFAESWGMPAAGAIVTVIFVILHLTETWHYPLSIVAIVALALATLAARLLTGTIAAAAALHAAYNGVMIVVTFATT